GDGSIWEACLEVPGSVSDGSSFVGPLSVVSFSFSGYATVYPADGAGVYSADVCSSSLNSDGVYTFTPVANYFGPVPVITYILTRSEERRVGKAHTFWSTPDHYKKTQKNEEPSVGEGDLTETCHISETTSAHDDCRVTST